ncbi:ABC transporter ATP-binding protein [Halorubrum lacusprofundi]|jgi:multiple sugar transport system ATP-binding protein|uniref:ABC-type D-xylose/L-arabinose transporter n=1 Tax=Halorubrum lacusprofundi (strain ATCC 49239 / DSM 5036 / JCM 8891 / ACAM 34) TaxID=416348 RepID=B9LTC4_HALLT|nr:sn-glycerol-3-phosphate ABC transporter ATP-binding protein UgpC [Halorubrum lacusprofundi]ACM58096.1 ABC transporter related [Halorubrum lacusprofundi ATCC 49239]MCG1006179.1 sn-glycerol-3-phosphate ABC transporter ATP-binding protein UgpC [Halorubrum lacusprofundi]
MATLELNSITKTFQDGDEEIVAVDDVSMSIDDGEFLVVVGPSGCGKSTTLRMIAGLETITSGTLSIDDRVVNDVKSQDRDIAMVFQSYALYPHMSVRQNMSFGLEESTDLLDDEINRMVSETGEMLGISPLLDRKPSDLSGGQQQRVALGRAIVRDPEVFLMDEPLSNLDAKLRAEMRTELQRLQNDLGVTTVYVTHDQTEAMTMGDRIAILDGGKLQQIASPLKCYHEPANQFVASFLGEPSMNFFDVTLDGDRLVGDVFEYPIGDDVRVDLGETADLVMGIRPEAIKLVASKSDAHEFEMTVDVVEPMGDENTVYLHFDPDADPESAATLVATIDGFTQVSEGDSVVAQIPEDAIHIFDRVTGEALHNRSMKDAADQVNLA